ncbi:anaphase-promoting complex subunit 4 isoform X3 [Apteryx rowi]|uniref:anaphase-promoting complex subunit 4 isoform X3 n=1 Tax=Apteryx rowi TaxID=308060 RepID=UPI000E1C6AEB|nr:anaphase-promoting complex subunit 4 isoform X3 [Apteryx rowi]
MPAFRQVGEKQLPQEVVFMAWSPKRDLIALANRAGEVLLHRLANFQRVWSLPPNENTGKEVTALAWRPDGKILAFGLTDTKRIILCDVEKPESLHSFSVDSSITYMHWMEVTEESSVLTSFYNAEDESNLLLPKLPALPKNYSTTAKIFSEEKSDEIMKLLGDVRLNALVVGGSSGFIEIYAYGMFKIAMVTGVPGSCCGLCLSGDLKSLSVITEIQDSPDSEAEMTYFQLDTSLLSSYLPEVTRMARKFTHISTLLQYIKLSLTCMCEAWEEILMQMDSRLTKFVQGLKKLGQSIESSYSSIQKLVISHLQSGSEALLYHLSELKGMALWKQKYECLGLDASGIEDAITAVGSFILKANELLQVIDSSMKNFKAFFRWLYVAMLRMSEDHVLPELNKMTQKDITFVADFLTEHFNEAPELYNRKGKYFNVERVGQYLKDEDDDLVSPPNTEGNQWFNFLKNSTHLKESPLLFPYYPEKSLHFVKRQMEEIIDQCLQKPADVIGKSVHQAVCMSLYKTSQSEDSTPQLFKLPFLWNDKTSNIHYVLFTMLESSVSKVYILRRYTDTSRSVSNGLIAVEFGNFLNNNINESSDSRCYSCLDAHFYDDETVTVVLKESVEQEGKERILAQLPLSSVYTDEDQEREFIWDSTKRLDEQSGEISTRTVFLENQWRVLENMKAQYVAVNGIRKVSCVLSSNLRHVRVFEMDVEDDGEAEEEEEEEEEEETTQIAAGEPEELNQSTDNQDSVCGASAEELPGETEEQELSLDP